MIDRRDILKLMGVGGVVFASGLAGAAKKKKSANDNADFFFLQLSDTHWGYAGVSNPEADVTLEEGGRDDQRASPPSPTSSCSPAISPTRPTIERRATSG